MNIYIQQAKEDIKNDSIVFRSAGGFVIGSELDKRFAASSTDMEFIIKIQDVPLMPLKWKASKNIKKLYLEKRNGKGWEDRMNNEIDLLKSKSSFDHTK